MPYSGLVHSWNDPRGYGFITSDDLQRETFFGRSSLPVELRDCARIFSLQGKKVGFELDEEKTGQNNAFVAASVQLQLAPGDQAVGTIKRYNPMKGFGFLACSAVDQDPFFAKKDVPLTMQNSHLEGTMASFVLELTQDGKLRASSLKFKEGSATSSAAIVPPGRPAPARVPAPAPALAGLEQPLPAPQRAALQALLAPLLAASLAPATLGGGGKAIPGKPAGAPSFDLAAALCGLAAASASAGSAGGTATSSGAVGGTSAAPSDGQAMSGTVVSFHSERGYGFITADNLSGDLYFRAEDCEGGPFEAGTRVALKFKAMHDGRHQARNVVLGMVDGDTYEGTVASYSQRNGYGFIALQAHPDGVYFKKAIVPSHLQETDLRGWKVRFLARLADSGKARADRVDFLDSTFGEPELNASVEGEMEEEGFAESEAQEPAWEEADEEPALEETDEDQQSWSRGPERGGSLGGPGRPRYTPVPPATAAAVAAAAAAAADRAELGQADREQWNQLVAGLTQQPPRAPVVRVPIDSRLRQQPRPAAAGEPVVVPPRKRPLSPLRQPVAPRRPVSSAPRAGLREGGGSFAGEW